MVFKKQVLEDVGDWDAGMNDQLTFKFCTNVRAPYDAYGTAAHGWLHSD